MKHHIGYNVKSIVMEYKCDSLQLFIIHRDKTKAHHDVINKRKTRINILTAIQKYAHRARTIHRS